MKNTYKIIRDAIHGDIQIDPMFIELLETPELQRLYNIKQLGLAHLVFPGAHHTRLEHSLGSYFLAQKNSEVLNLPQHESQLLTCAALLHDIGHGPFSHTLESLLRQFLHADHVEMTEQIISGKYNIFIDNENQFVTTPSVSEILEKYQINPIEVAQIIKGKYRFKPYLSQILNSAIDVDQLDYLIRDAYYTGVAYGTIDIDRYLQTQQITNNTLTTTRKGVSVVESILMARALMYSSVYFHKTVRIAELMLLKALEQVKDRGLNDLFKMTDAEFITQLKKLGLFQHKIVTCLKYRKLFKQAYTASLEDLSEENINTLEKFENTEERAQKEEEIEKRLHIPPGHIIIDIPSRELQNAEPRLRQTDILVADKDTVRSLNEFTPMAQAILSRSIPDWRVMIITEEKYRGLVKNQAQELLFS